MFMTQLESAVAGVVTKEMKVVAEKEWNRLWIPHQKQDERDPEIEQKEDKLVKIYNVSQKQEKDYISKRNNTAVKPW